MVIFFHTFHYFTDEIRSECTKFFNSLHLSITLTLTNKSISGWSLWFPHRKSISGRSFTARNADAITPVTRAKTFYLYTEVKPLLKLRHNRAKSIAGSPCGDPGLESCKNLAAIRRFGTHPGLIRR